jgi:hypothetical protein
MTLRQVQRETNCSTKTLKLILVRLRPFLKVEPHEKLQLKKSDSVLCEPAYKIELHGCVRCHKYVFTPLVKVVRCPRCGHPRRNVSGDPNEVLEKHISSLFTSPSPVN